MFFHIYSAGKLWNSLTSREDQWFEHYILYSR